MNSVVENMPLRVAVNLMAQGGSPEEYEEAKGLAMEMIEQNDDGGRNYRVFRVAILSLACALVTVELQHAGENNDSVP